MQSNAIKDFIRYFDQESVMDRAFDKDKDRYCVNFLRRDEQRQIVDEIGRCQDDFEYTARNYFQIIAESGEEVPFDLWPSQMLILEKWYELRAQGRQAKVLIIKARRLGCSTVVESLMAWTTMFHTNKPGIIISNESKHASFLFRMLLHILDKLPWWMKPMVSSRQEQDGLIFNNPNREDRRFNPGLQSEILVQAATGIDPGGQGRRVACIHASEFAGWDDDTASEIILEDMKPALGTNPEHFAFLESTAKGAGRFAHLFWRDNLRLKENAEWYPLFMPWFFEKTRVLAPPNGWIIPSKEKDMRDRAMRDWLRCTNLDCGEYRESAIYPELFEEPCLRCKIGKMMPLLLSEGQLKWMNFERINAEGNQKRKRALLQEFCSTAEESFQVSGYPIFDADTLDYINSTIREPLAIGDFDSKGNFHGVLDKKTKQCYQPWCQIDHTYSENHLEIWKFPEDGFSYCCGVDVSEGLGGQSDYSVAFINKIGRSAGEPDEQVATYRNNTIDPIPFAAVCNWLGRWFNEALMAVECNKYDTTLSQLRQAWQYPNVFRWKWVDSTNMLSNKWGWWTNMSSKPRLWQTAKKWLKDRCWIIYSSNLMEEMKTFQKESPEDRGASAENNMKDDECIASMIALYTAHDMDVGENVGYSSPLRVDGPGVEIQSTWTAKCNRCPAPAWQCGNPEYSRCPKCGCRMITATPNMPNKPSVVVDFNDIGRDPAEPEGISRTTFEYNTKVVN